MTCFSTVGKGFLTAPNCVEDGAQPHGGHHVKLSRSWHVVQRATGAQMPRPVPPCVVASGPLPQSASPGSPGIAFPFSLGPRSGPCNPFPGPRPARSPPRCVFSLSRGQPWRRCAAASPLSLPTGRSETLRVALVLSSALWLWPQRSRGTLASSAASPLHPQTSPLSCRRGSPCTPESSLLRPRSALPANPCLFDLDVAPPSSRRPEICLLPTRALTLQPWHSACAH